jgi:quinol monooxygenase YgiN
LSTADIENAREMFVKTLSKSKLLAYRQCPKRLWLEVNHPGLRADSSATLASFSVGNQVGEIARALYDPAGKGVLINPQEEGFDAAFARSQKLLKSSAPIFEAGFKAEGVLAFADVMLPTKKGSRKTWRMVEVKSSTSVKDYHQDDAAIQAFVAQAAGVPLQAIALAHINSEWVYRGKQDYQGLLKEEDLSEAVMERGVEVQGWIAGAQKVLTKRKAPDIQTGKQCAEPFECGFLAHCGSQEPQAEFPVAWLPGPKRAGFAQLAQQPYALDMRDVPDDFLSDVQQRVKKYTLSNKVHFDKRATKEALADYKLPAYFMDFETVQFAVPIWKGTRPYQQIPFQFSVHRLDAKGQLRQQAFLEVNGKDPSKAFALALIEACGKRGPIFVYNAGFEVSRMKELAQRFKALAPALNALIARVVDLLPIARKNYYHPSQQGSWSIKAVLPALCPELSYSELSGVQNGGMAMEAFMEAIQPQTSAERKAELKQQLLDYCALDTYAMVKIWSKFTGSTLKA